MDRKDRTDSHWDREQVTRDTDGPPTGAQDKVWDRDQVARDNPGPDADALVGTHPDKDDSGGLSGHGHPSGESHWERNDPAD